MNQILSALYLLSSMISAQEHVILLHGLGRTKASMEPIATHLKQHGYKTHNIGYPSRKKSIHDLSQDHLAPAIESVSKQGAKRIHFVTHSMGGILLQDYLSHHSMPNRGHSILIAPPSQGCEIVDKLGHWRLFRWINGTAGKELGTSATSTPNKLAKLTSSKNAAVGVIAGNRTSPPFCSLFLPGKNDGKVTVESTKIEGCHHTIIRATHTFIMRNKTAKRLTLKFLRTGEF